MTCTPDEDAPVVVFISKMVSVRARSYFSAKKENFHGYSNDKRLIGYGRLFSGTLKAGSRLYIYNAKSQLGDEVPSFTCDDIFIMMGGENLKQVT